MQRHIFRNFVVISILMFSVACKKDEKGAPEAVKNDYKGTIVAAGDSLTAGFGLAEDQAYPAQLERRLHKEGLKYRVVNAGISGETSSGLLSRVRWILNLKPAIVIIETGANDGFRGIDPELTRKNIEEAVKILKENRVSVVLAGMQIVQNLGSEYADAFKAVYPAVAKKEGVILIPFFLEGLAGNPSLNQSDGIHPTAEGYRFVVDNVYPHVVTAIKGLNR